MVVEDGSVRKLDIGAGSLEKLADCRDHFADVIDEENNANDWLVIPLVDKLVSDGVLLAPGECYSYVQRPALGGDSTTANPRVVSLARHSKAFGPIPERIKDLPDGTRVKFDVTG